MGGVEKINDHIISRMRLRFGNMVMQAICEQNAEIAKEVYENTLNLPQTETTQQLFIDGYTVNDKWNECEKFTLCFRDGDPCLLKYLNPKEATRAKNFKDLAGDYMQPHFMSYILKTYGEKNYLIIPFYVSKLERISIITVNTGVKLMNQMLSAIDFIHSKGFNHMDITPSNICINEQGNFILTNIDSIVTKNENSESTIVYVPPDFQPRSPENSTSNLYKADNFIDFWMLGVTIAEKVFEVIIGDIAPTPKCEVLLNILSRQNDFKPLVERIQNNN